MKTSLLSIIAAFGLFTTISAQAAPTVAPVTSLRVEASHKDPRRMNRAERARLERERKLAAERARQEQLRHRNDHNDRDNRRSDYGYVRH